MDYEHLPGDGPLDETDSACGLTWPASLISIWPSTTPPGRTNRSIAWDGNFRSDGA